MKPCFSSLEPESICHDKSPKGETQKISENGQICQNKLARPEEKISNPESSLRDGEENSAIITECQTEEGSSADTSCIKESTLSSSIETLPESMDTSVKSDLKEALTTPSSKGVESKVLEETQITPKKAMSPKQLQKRLESEKKRKQKQLEREEKEKKKQEEKEEKLRLKLEKEEQKRKEKEEKEQQKRKEREEKELQKKKEKEEKEQKRREKEEREEQKRKEKEQERLKKQQEIDEKNREKQKQEQQKQKAAAAFVNFFVPLKTDASSEDKKPTVSSAFMPFEVKSDMRLAPVSRNSITVEEKEKVSDALRNQDSCVQTYLEELKGGRKPRKSGKTWVVEDTNDDVIIIEEGVTLGETVDEQKPKVERMRAKFFKFHENQRPPYYGTWRKVSRVIKPRRPHVQDKQHLDYEVDSDDDWEEEEHGESITGSDGEDKDNESDNEYDVDNKFFVPHGYLSEDEVDDEETVKLSPESHKAKLKLLKNEFEEEMNSKTQRIKPRVISCVWCKQDDQEVDEAIDFYLQPLAIIANKPIIIKERDFQNYSAIDNAPTVDSKLVPSLLELIHGSTKNKKALTKEFLAYLKNKDTSGAVTARSVLNTIKQCANWIKCPEEGPLFDKFCWYVSDDVKKKHNVKLSLPNKWVFVSKENEV